MLINHFKKIIDFNRFADIIITTCIQTLPRIFAHGIGSLGYNGNITVMR